MVPKLIKFNSQFYIIVCHIIGCLDSYPNELGSKEYSGKIAVCLINK